MRIICRPTGRAGTNRLGPRRTQLIIGAMLLVLAAAACTSHATDSRDPAADTVHSLGAVPIPSPPTAQATPLADENHLQLLAIGAPVRAVLPEASAVVAASGPTEDLPSAGPMPKRVTGTITITIDAATAPLTIAATDFTSRDERGNPVSLTARGARTVTVGPGQAATLTLTGTYGSGAAQITWRHRGKVIAVWDFNIELD